MVLVSRHETITRGRRGIQFVEDAGSSSVDRGITSSLEEVQVSECLLDDQSSSVSPFPSFSLDPLRRRRRRFDVPRRRSRRRQQRHRTAIEIGRFSGTAADFRLMDLEEETRGPDTRRALPSTIAAILRTGAWARVSELHQFYSTRSI